MEVLKSLISPRDIINIIVVGLFSSYITGLFKSDEMYSLREENKKLETALNQADSIISVEQNIIDVAIMKDTTALGKVDSIQIIRDENKTVTFKLSDIDSLRALWPNH